MKQNLKDIESIIKSSKTINSQDSMLLEFGFKLNGKKVFTVLKLIIPTLYLSILTLF